MNERLIASAVLGDLRTGLPGAVVVKHNDVGTKGVPDIQVARLDRTSWIELKHLRQQDTLKSINKAEQLIFCHQLATVNNGRCWVIIFEEIPHRMTIWQPRVLFAKLWPRVAGPLEPDNVAWHQAVATEPVIVPNLNAGGRGLAATVHSLGALSVPGWHYDVARRLVTDALGGR